MSRMKDVYTDAQEHGIDVTLPLEEVLAQLDDLHGRGDLPDPDEAYERARDEAALWT